MPSDVTVFASRTDSMSRTDGSNVCRCWSAGDHDDLTELAREIQRHSVDTLVIQFNYGFFNLETFGNFLVLHKKLGHTIVVTMHATNDPVHVPHKKLSLLATALKCCDRVLVHSPHDMNRLKRLGVIENVTLFPHGLIDYTPNKLVNVYGRDFVVASYGFFLPHKGLLELIDAIAILDNQGVRIRLNMVNAEYPAVESSDVIQQAKEKIKKCNLDRRVSICTEFLSDAESLERLSSANLIVFPYQITGESSSAAVRYGLASGRPVAVTPLDIFDDVAQAVHILPGTTPAEIAKGIALLVSQLSNADELVQNKEQQAEQWRVEHRYSKVGPRLNQMLIALCNQQNSKF